MVIPLQRAFSIFKSRVTQHNIYVTRNEAEADIFNFIEVFYKPIKRHFHTGGLSLAKLEEAYCLELKRI